MKTKKFEQQIKIRMKKAKENLERDKLLLWVGAQVCWKYDDTLTKLQKLSKLVYHRQKEVRYLNECLERLEFLEKCDDIYKTFKE